MSKRKFWRWMNQTVPNPDSKTEAPEEDTERILSLNGTIAEDSWFDDDVTPAQFREELMAGSGNVVVWINSPGGDCIAAAQIYNMLSEYPGHITVKVDGLAASAASVIAMAGDEVQMSPVSMLMIHNPATLAFGDHTEMQKAIELLDAVKESIINAYVRKTGLSRARISHLMDAETWMDANKAVELGFADGILYSESDEEQAGNGTTDAVMFSRRAVNNALVNKLEAHYGVARASAREQAEIPATDNKVTDRTGSGHEEGRSAEEIRGRLSLMKRFI